MEFAIPAWHLGSGKPLEKFKWTLAKSHPFTTGIPRAGGTAMPPSRTGSTRWWGRLTSSTASAASRWRTSAECASPSSSPDGTGLAEDCWLVDSGLFHVYFFTDNFWWWRNSALCTTRPSRRRSRTLRSGHTPSTTRSRTSASATGSVPPGMGKRVAPLLTMRVLCQ